MEEDVGKAPGDAAAPPGRLLQLPKELQLIIWEFALIEPDAVPFFTTETMERRDTKNSSDKKCLRWNTPSLLQVCHSCRVEGISIFYSNNLFVLRHEQALARTQARRPDLLSE